MPLGILAGLLIALSGCSATSAEPPDPPKIPGKDEIVTSPNMRLLANVPKQGPFATPLAYNSDLAFKGRYAFAGNYEGFVIYDIADPSRPRIVSQIHCPGSQNDVSVAGNLLFLSTDTARSNNSCQSTTRPSTDTSAWEGIKIFDISDVTRPRYIKAVETQCGSHTHTLMPGKRGTTYVYVSSYLGSGTNPDCSQPHDKISIIKVQASNPKSASVVATPVLFPDGGNPGFRNPGGTGTSATTGCHDLTTYPARNLMAGACMGDGVLFDVSEPEKPRILSAVRDDDFAFWHSATFNQSATKVVFTDELGGGGSATCVPGIRREHGADAVYDIIAGKLVFRSFYKIPRIHAATENCVAHNGSLIPVPGRDIMVQGWFQGGVSVWDFTDSRRPRELGFFDRGPWSGDAIPLGGSWSAYYYNGHIYSNDIQKGMDVLEIKDPTTDPARQVKLAELNVQTQPDYFRGRQ